MLKLKAIISNPYKHFYNKNRCIFIHIPKSAGISVATALFGERVEHRKYFWFLIFNPLKFNQYFKFTFVRNPWDRFVSAYFFLKKGGRNQNDKVWADKYLNPYDTFESFVNDLDKNKKIAKQVLKHQHFTPQYKYICNKKGKVMVDFVGRLENIEKDFEHIKNQLNLPEAKLEHLNKSSHESYTNYYNEKTKNIIAKLYAKDIELFGYKF